MSKPIRWLRRGATLASLGVVGGALAVTARHLLAVPQPLESRLFGESLIDRRAEGDIYYDVAGPVDAEPVVLLHDFYAGASGDEFRRLYPRLTPDYRVYAPDWLGFGLSERPALAYTGEFYANLLIGYLRETVRRPAIVIASGLAGNIAVRAAADAPDLFARLVLIEPRPLAGTLPGPNATQTAVRLLQRASLGLIPYAMLSTRTALRWQLRRHAAYAGEGAATDDVLDHAYASAHQFGGQHALLALLTGEFDLPIENVLSSLVPSVLIVGGAGDGSRSLAALQDMALLHPQARLLTIPESGPAVHEDQPAALMEQLGAWLRAPAMRSTPRITETRSTARGFAGAMRVERTVSAPGPDTRASAAVAAAAPSATARVAGPSTAPADAGTAQPSVVAPQSEMTQVAQAAQTTQTASGTPAVDDTASAARIAQAAVAPDATLREQFDEPHGVVSPAAGLEGLSGLVERVPDADQIDDGYDLIPEARPLPADVSGSHQVGKPASEIEESPASVSASVPASVPATSKSSTFSTANASTSASSQQADTQPDLSAIRPRRRASSSTSFVTGSTAPSSEPAMPDTAAGSTNVEGMVTDMDEPLPASASEEAPKASPSARRTRSTPPVAPASAGGSSTTNESSEASAPTKHGSGAAEREWPIPGGRKRGSHHHKHGHH